MNATPTRFEVQGKSVHFVTGRLAEHALREMLEVLRETLQFNYTVQVLPITVAALMTPKWVARHVEVSPEYDLSLIHI